MVDLKVPAKASFRVITDEDGSSKVSIPKAAFGEAVAGIAPIQQPHQRSIEPSCVYPADDYEES